MTGRAEQGPTGERSAAGDEARDDVPNPDEGLGIGADAGTSFEPEEDPEPAEDRESSGPAG